MTLGEKIAQSRKEKKLSQEELAELLQVSRQAVSKWENDLSKPDTDNLIRLADLFEIDINQLVGNQVAVKEKRSIHIIPALCVCLAVFVLTTALFAILWQKDQKPSPDTAVQVPETTVQENVVWESVKLYSGLLREEIQLTLEEKSSLLMYISLFHFTERTEIDNASGDFIYGGRIYRVEYETEGVSISWYFSENGFSQTIRLEDGTEMIYYFDVDYALFYEIDKYIFESKTYS